MNLKRIVFLLICALTLNSNVFAQGEIDILKTQGSFYWANRDNQEALLKSLDFFTKAHEIQPKNTEILIYLTIGYFWKGNNMLNNPNAKADRITAYETGIKYAEKLIQLNPDSVEGNFWHATNNASACNERGFMKSALNISDIKSRNSRVMELDKFYYNGGPQRLAARVIWGTPRFFRSGDEGLDKAVSLLKQAIKHEPNFTLSHLFLADVYWEMKERDLSKEELMTVLNIPENALVGFEAQNRFDKKDANAKLKEYFGDN